MSSLGTTVDGAPVPSSVEVVEARNATKVSRCRCRPVPASVWRTSLSSISKPEAAYDLAARTPLRLSPVARPCGRRPHRAGRLDRCLGQCRLARLWWPPPSATPASAARTTRTATTAIPPWHLHGHRRRRRSGGGRDRAETALTMLRARLERETGDPADRVPRRSPSRTTKSIDSARPTPNSTECLRPHCRPGV